MKLTEQIQVKKSKELSHLCHLAKNLYNVVNWYIRQEFFSFGNILYYNDLEYILKTQDHHCYRSLPIQTSQQIIKLVCKNWKSYFKAKQSYKEDPSKFLGFPQMPNYKRKNGESIVIFTNQNAYVKKNNKNQYYIQFPKMCKLPHLITRIQKFNQIRIIPKGRYYVYEIVYKHEEENLGLDKERKLSIDLGVNNLLTTANNIGQKPIIVKGKNIKSINQFYNKVRAKNRSQVDSRQPETRKMAIHTRKRNNKIRDFFHKTSRKINDYCIENNIGTIIIGYNETWKQESNMGRKNNQNFVSIPFLKLISMITYKAKLIGINVILTEESYTSKCSALDREDLCYHEKYKGKRIKRGLFKASCGTKINADVNGAMNIMRKVVPTDFTINGIEAMVLSPQIVKIN